MRVLTRPDRNGPPVWRPIINHTVFKAEDQVKKEKKKKELENRRRPAEHGQGRNAMIRLRGAKRRKNERERERERFLERNVEKRSEIVPSLSRETMITRRFTACVFNDDH